MTTRIRRAVAAVVSGLAGPRATRRVDDGAARAIGLARALSGGGVRIDRNAVLANGSDRWSGNPTPVRGLHDLAALGWGRPDRTT